MPKRPSAIDASTLLATKEKTPGTVAGSLQRGQSSSDTLVDLNFKVSPEFRQRFRRLAFDAGLKNVQLLTRALAAWERAAGQGRQS
jgi:hypothetical protein